MITFDNYQDKKSTIDWKAMPKNISDTRNDVEDIMEFYNDDADIKETVDLFLKGINSNLPKTENITTAKVKKSPLVIYKEGKFITKKTLQSEYSFTDNENLAYTWAESEKSTAEKIAKGYDGLVIDMKEANRLTKLMQASQANREKTYPTKKKETLQDAFLNARLTRSLMPKRQQMAVLENDESEEVQFFIDKVKEFEKRFQKIEGERQNNSSIQESTVYIHYFYGETHWFVTEYHDDHDEFFGYVVLNGDTQNSEPGYFSVPEILSVKGIELDFYFTPKNLGKELKTRYPGEFGDDEDEASAVANQKYGKNYVIAVLKDLGTDREATKRATKNLDSNTIQEIRAELIKDNFSGKYLDSTVIPKIQAELTTKVAPKVTMAKKEKIEKVIDKTIVDNLSPEFLLIRRFWNLIKKENISVPFRTVQLLYMAFNKAAVERKVRKTSEAAELFTKCNKKIIMLFEDIPNNDKKPYEIEFTDKGLYKEIQEYVSDVAVNPAIPVLKRFIAIQNTKPDVKKAGTLLKSMTKIIETSKENRLSPELSKARKELEDYIKKPSETIEPTIYGLSVPRTVCTNRIKCAGIDKTGKLHKGYNFQEHTGNIVKVRKTKSRLGSPNVCENRVKCTGLSKTGKLLPGYKFEEGTNHVVKVRKTTRKPAKKPTAKKKVAAGLGLVFNEGIERIYVDQSPIIPIVQEKAQVMEDFDYSNLDPRGNQEQSIPVARPVEKEKANLTVNRNSLAYRREKNKNVTHEYYAIENPDVSEFLGQIEKKKKESVAITIAGGQGSGKTSFVFQLMNAFAKNYKVGHASIEEHPESALYENKAERFWDDKAKATVDSPEINSMKDIHDLIMRNDVIVIDSFSKLLSMDNKITLDDTFRKKYDGKLFVVIYQLTTDGKMRGGSSSQFDGDVILFVEKSANFNDNYVFADKNRYQNRSLDELHYNIASAKLMTNEPEPILEFTEVERI